MSEAKEMISLPKKLFARIWFKLTSEAQQDIYDSLSKEELEELKELISAYR